MPSRSILSPSIFQTPFPMNALSALMWLAQRRHQYDTDRLDIQNKQYKTVIFMFILGNIINPQDFDQYILTSEDGSFYCGICNQAMNQKGHLKEHIEAKHFPNVFSYQCSECSHVVGSKIALRNHKKRTHPKNQMLYDQFIGIDSFEYYRCFIFTDSGAISTPQDLEQFVLMTEDGSFCCGICHQAMNQKGKLKRHIESKHFPNLFSYQCTDCSRKALERHRE